MAKKVAVIVGAGFGGLGAAGMLSKAGYEVKVYEKNSHPGGRANYFEKDGFKFDMGPSWYLMPDIFEHFFALMGEKIEDHIELKRLDPSYRVYFKDRGVKVDIAANLEDNIEVLESLEKGSYGVMLEYLRRSKLQYEIAKDNFIYKNYDSIFDFFSLKLAIQGAKLSVFKKMNAYVENFFKTDFLQKLVQYPLVFLGSSPYNTPAIYNIMSHIDFNLGVFYPQGGIHELVKTIEKIAKKNGADFYYNAPVKKILTSGGVASGILLEDGSEVGADIVISNADMAFTELQLLDAAQRDHDATYFAKQTLAPSALLMYVGVNKKLKGFQHHTLVFSQDWQKNFGQIFDQPVWPEDPSLYVCVPSMTDSTVAPEGQENLLILVPIAAGLEYDQAFLEDYGKKIIKTLEIESGETIQENILFTEYFCVKDFEETYNSYNGTALGLAHILTQTAIFRPNNVSKKTPGLYYVGAGTNPGIGMPMCLISAELLYKRLAGDRSSGPVKEIKSLDLEK